MPNPCAAGTQGILAYSNVDLVPNGFIPENAEDSRGNTLRMLPSNRLTVELQYSVRSDITGTSLNSLSPGGNAGFIFGGLGLGSGAAIGSALGCSLLGDIEPTISRFVFHVCESETRLNRAVLVTEAMLASAEENDGVAVYDFINEYPIGVLGATRDPIELTAEEETNIGSSGGPTRGHTISNSGQIEASFQDYDSASERNLFIEIVRDERKYQYRADNTGFANSGANCFTSGSPDDLTDTKIRIRLRPPDNEVGPPSDTPLAIGDILYFSYTAASKRLLRQAIFVSSFFFLFPGFQVERIGEDKINAWNFHPFRFMVHKRADRKATIADIREDARIDAREDLDSDEKAERRSLEMIEGQRICECINDSKTQRPYVRGFYFADTRGILSYDRESMETQLLVPASGIRDQSWWNKLVEYVDFGPGFNAEGHLDPESADANRFLRGFVFDISDHVNCLCYDNDKFGYQRILADSISDVSAMVEGDASTGVGAPNLDMIRLSLPSRHIYDLSSAKFQSTTMSSIESSAYFVRDCNKIFTYDQQFCAQGTLQADMFIRTPIFFDDYPKKSRIYLERYSPQLPLARDGGVWVTTRPVFSGGISVDAHPYQDDGFLVFEKDGILNYHRFRDASAKVHLSKIETDYAAEDRSHENLPFEQLTQEDVAIIGFDKMIGNQPGYSRGLEITRESGKIAIGIESASIYKTIELPYAQNESTGEITVADLSGKRIKNISITYRPGFDFLSRKLRYISFIFPNTRLIIDNIALPYEGLDIREKLLYVDTRYYYGDSLRISGSILKDMIIKKISVTYLDEEKYLENAIDAGASSVVLDSQGRIYVFYEDNKASEGRYYEVTDGSDGIDGPVTEGLTEISCLISNDMGHTWFDHKGVVYTAGSENIRAPYAIVERKSNVVHLLYVNNDTLLHKTFEPGLFVHDDAFRAWKRPTVFNEDTSDNFGLLHFSNRGRQLRKKESSVIIGNINQSGFLRSQLDIGRIRKANNRSVRIAMSGDFQNFEDGFPETDLIAYFDRKKALRVLYVSNGRLFARISDSNGQGWVDAFPGGAIFHRNNSVQEARSISSLGCTFDEQSNVLIISYIADEMLFLRSFDGSLFDASRSDIQRIVDPSKAGTRPIFVVGSIGEEVMAGIEDDTSNIVFVYPKDSLERFDQNMSVSQIGAKGFAGASGLIRFYYQDSNGDMRAFSVLDSQLPMLDAKARSL